MLKIISNPSSARERDYVLPKVINNWLKTGFAVKQVNHGEVLVRQYFKVIIKTTFA